MLAVRIFLMFSILASVSFAGDMAGIVRTQDVIYGRKFGTALTMDVIKPKENPNGLGIVYCVSGGWFSNHDDVDGVIMASTFFLKRGYTIFAVVHGSQPKFTIPEVLSDMHRAVRFIRFNAKKYGVDPDRLGITGGSAGGHLSLMMGTSGNDGDPKSEDPIERVSSRVQCVACFFPPTDFLNYGKTGQYALGDGILKDYRAPFDFHTFDESKNMYVRITDDKKIKELGRAISPIYHVTAKSAPMMIAHGDADKLVPIQQAEIFIDKLKSLGVECKLVRKAGGDHGWDTIADEMNQCAEWFDAHLKTAAPKK